jgi:hypothetical protein
VIGTHLARGTPHKDSQKTISIFTLCSLRNNHTLSFLTPAFSREYSHIALFHMSDDNNQEPPTSPLSTNVTTPTVLQGFIDSALEVAQRSLAESTLANYRAAFGRFKAWCAQQQVQYEPLSADLPRYIIGYLQANYMMKNKAMTTIDGEYSAIKHHYDTLNHTERWCMDADGNYRGNPCTAKIVSQYRAGCERSLRDRPVHSSQAILLDGMAKLHAGFRHVIGDNERNVPSDKRLGLSYAEALMLDALFSLSWYCWLRIEEALQLKFKNFLFNQTSSTGKNYFVLKIDFRKTNQRDIKKGSCFEIYEDLPCDDEKVVDAYKKLKQWIDYLGANNIAVNANNFVFRQLRGQQVLNKPATDNWVRFTLKSIAVRLDIIKDETEKLTTHCFRRGGAQHRFFYARHPWSLTSIRAWGGWSKGEAADTILRYLVDEYTSKDSDYRNMMSPDRRDRNLSVINYDDFDESNQQQNLLRTLHDEFRLFKAHDAAFKATQESFRTSFAAFKEQDAAWKDHILDLLERQQPSSSRNRYITPRANLAIRPAATSSQPTANIPRPPPRPVAPLQVARPVAAQPAITAVQPVTQHASNIVPPVPRPATAQSSQQQHQSQQASSSAPRTRIRPRRGRPRTQVDPRRLVHQIPTATSFEQMKQQWFDGEDDVPPISTWSKKDINHVDSKRSSRKSQYSKRKTIFKTFTALGETTFMQTFNHHIVPKFKYTSLYRACSDYLKAHQIVTPDEEEQVNSDENEVNSDDDMSE